MTMDYENSVIVIHIGETLAINSDGQCFILTHLKLFSLVDIFAADHTDHSNAVY